MDAMDAMDAMDIHDLHLSGKFYPAIDIIEGIENPICTIFIFPRYIYLYHHDIYISKKKSQSFLQILTSQQTPPRPSHIPPRITKAED